MTDTVIKPPGRHYSVTAVVQGLIFFPTEQKRPRGHAIAATDTDIIFPETDALCTLFELRERVVPPTLELEICVLHCGGV
jgi:hypothetical protein